ncbi:hypothetical protein HLPCO_000927 [Haloplasma contractile SSD-17B]|uniref:Uncharacterized protein n=1 Tax=Haloplasma contractile SSD-17B TaxID=1033810 RepID=F7PWE6_9MOLU|nr:hypothetical protein HLPCO_000927 [Haloplasma contractile SSD-17B]
MKRILFAIFSYIGAILLIIAFLIKKNILEFENEFQHTNLLVGISFVCYGIYSVFINEVHQLVISKKYKLICTITGIILVIYGLALVYDSLCKMYNL